MSDEFLGALYGVIGTVGVGILTVLIAWRVGKLQILLGWLQLKVMRDAHRFAIVKSLPRIGCHITIEDRMILGMGFGSYIWVYVTLYNEGELPAEDVTGNWKVSACQFSFERIFPIQRDFLGKCQEQSYSHRIEDSANWGRENISFEIEVEFLYSVPGLNKEETYHAKYRYDPQTKQMAKRYND